MKNEQRTDAKDWLVAVGAYADGIWSKPAEFISNPESRIQPTWVFGVVQAATRSESYDAGLTAWEKGLQNGQQPGQELMNWYVAPLDGVEPNDEGELAGQ